MAIWKSPFHFTNRNYIDNFLTFQPDFYIDQKKAEGYNEKSAVRRPRHALTYEDKKLLMKIKNLLYNFSSFAVSNAYEYAVGGFANLNTLEVEEAHSTFFHSLDVLNCTGHVDEEFRGDA